MDIAKLDRFMQARPAQEEGVRWLAPFEPPLVLEGFAFFEQDGAYRRLPLDSDAVFSRARASRPHRAGHKYSGRLHPFSQQYGTRACPSTSCGCLRHAPHALHRTGRF